MKQKILTMILLASLTVSMLTGCGQPETASTADTQTTETTAQPEEPEQAEEVVTETAETEVASAEEPEATTEPSTEEVTPEPTEEPEPTPEYTYTDMNATMYATQTVNVRNLPSTDGEKVGSLSANQEVQVTRQASTGWWRIQYNGGEAFVSDKYLSDEKVETPATSETPSNGGESSGGQAQVPTNNSDWKNLYSAGIWYDMGEFVFIIEYGNDWTMQHNWSDWEGKYPYVDFSAQAKTDDARIFFAYSNPDSKTLSNFLKQYTH